MLRRARHRFIAELRSSRPGHASKLASEGRTTLAGMVEEPKRPAPPRGGKFSSLADGLFTTVDTERWRKIYEEEEGKKAGAWTVTPDVRKAIKHGDPLVVTLRAQIHIESRVTAIVHTRLEKPAALEAVQKHWEYGRMLALALAMGLLPDSLGNFYRRLGELRNTLAHRPNAVPTDQDLDNLINCWPDGRQLTKEFAAQLYFSDTLVARFRTMLRIAVSIIDRIAEQAERSKPRSLELSGLLGAVGAQPRRR